MASTITEFSHSQIPLQEVLEATNHFDENNVIGEGELGKVYKGWIMRSGKWVKIAARRLDSKHKQGIEFLTEISVLSSLKHDNIVSFIGFCDEDGEKVIINKHEAKGSLVMYLSNPTLTWIQRLKICVGVARALSYIHKEDGRNYSIIHRNINSSTILLDGNFEAKLSGFEYSINHSVHRMGEVLFLEALGTTGYMDPAIETTGGVTHKSDIYSFGVVLWEILCGRKAYIPNADVDASFLAPLARVHYESNTVHDIIQSALWNQMVQNSRNVFLNAAYSCLRDERVQRPDMNYIVHELEEALEIQLPYENLRNNFEQLSIRMSELKIRLPDVKLATDNFSNNFIRRTKYYKLYRAELEHFDQQNFASVEENSEPPKRRSTVLIKRILPRSDNYDKEIFFTELEMLATCNHRNTVTLLGFCDEGSEMILVVEDASNGFLNSYFQSNQDRSILKWAERLKICLDVARGLHYLHHEMEDQKMVINRNIMSSAIALDENWRAKIFEFGISVLLPPNQDYIVHKFVDGSDKYIDPEYEKTGNLNRKSDVYNFGVVLCEILCGRAANDIMYLRDNKDNGLVDQARECFYYEKIDEIIDPAIKEESADNYSFKIFTKIAHKCVATTQLERPKMEVVIKELERALSMQEQGNLNDMGKDEISIAGDITHIRPVPLQDDVEIRPWNRQKDDILEHLNITLSDMKLATDNFRTMHVKSYQFYYYYIAEFEFFDRNFFASVEENNKSELPTRWTTVVLKRVIYGIGKRGEEAFFTEINILKHCKHPNIVTLLGVCDEDSEKIIMIEYFSNGQLSQYLENIKDKPILTWAQRLKICLDVARGLNYLHYEMGDKKRVIHHSLSCYTIYLDENWGAKIADFCISVLFPPNQDDDAIQRNHADGYLSYIDPEYFKTYKLRRESDVYSFGVVLCEILLGTVADDQVYKKVPDHGLAYLVRTWFRDGTLKEMIDPIIKEERGNNNFTLNRGPNKDSLDAFLKIAYECLGETHDQRPTMKVVVKELEKALFFQDNNKDEPKISLADIQLATKNFHDDNIVGGGGFGKVYKGKLPQGDDTIVAKQLDTRGGQGEQQFRNELEILFEYKHENIINLVGYCDEKDAKIIVYEYAPRGSLDSYLSDARLNWIRRLNICIDVAIALDFLHTGVGKQATVIHRDIKTANILLTGDWNAKLADFGLSLRSAINQKTDYVIDWACGTPGYVDPLYLKLGFLTKESDIYSFGVVLVEILCGRTMFVRNKKGDVFLPSFIKHDFEKEKLDEVVFKEIKAEIMPEALTTFQRIAFKCLHDIREKRPKAKEVVEQLKKALELQMSTGDGASTKTSTDYQLQD